MLKLTLFALYSEKCSCQLNLEDHAPPSLISQTHPATSVFSLSLNFTSYTFCTLKPQGKALEQSRAPCATLVRVPMILLVMRVHSLLKSKLFLLFSTCRAGWLALVIEFCMVQGLLEYVFWHLFVPERTEA